MKRAKRTRIQFEDIVRVSDEPSSRSSCLCTWDVKPIYVFALILALGITALVRILNEKKQRFQQPGVFSPQLSISRPSSEIQSTQNEFHIFIHISPSFFLWIPPRLTRFSLQFGRTFSVYLLSSNVLMYVQFIGDKLPGSFSSHIMLIISGSIIYCLKREIIWNRKYDPNRNTAIELDYKIRPIQWINPGRMCRLGRSLCHTYTPESSDECHVSIPVLSIHMAALKIVHGFYRPK